MTSRSVSAISVLQRRYGDYAATDPPDDLAGGLPERPGPRRVGHLATQVDQLLDPAHEVAGGEVVLVEHVAEVVTLGPSVRRPGQARVRASEEVQPVVPLDGGQLAPEALQVVDRASRVTTRDPWGDDVLGAPRLVDERRQRGGQTSRPERSEEHTSEIQ